MQDVEILAADELRDLGRGWAAAGRVGVDAESPQSSNDSPPGPGRILLEHPDAARLCPQYLSTLAYIPWTGVPLMQVALGRARELEAGDDVAAGVAAYLEHHIIEEMHGDELRGSF